MHIQRIHATPAINIQVVVTHIHLRLCMFVVGMCLHARCVSISALVHVRVQWAPFATRKRTKQNTPNLETRLRLSNRYHRAQGYKQRGKLKNPSKHIDLRWVSWGSGSFWRPTSIYSHFAPIHWDSCGDRFAYRACLEVSLFCIMMVASSFHVLLHGGC